MKKVKIATIIFAIILVTLVAFAGVYIQVQNRMENKVKDYTFSKDLERERIVELKVVDSTMTDSEGNAYEDQNPEILTEKNFSIVKNTIEKRLKKLKADDYIISLNRSNGTIKVELPENENTDAYAYYLTADSEVEIKEKDSETQLLNDSVVKSAKYSYLVDAENQYQVYLEIKLNKDGQAKIEEIAKTYAVLANEIDEIEEAQNQEEENEGTEQTETTETSEENQEQAETKKIAVLSIGGSEYDIDKIEKEKIIAKIGSKTSNSISVNNNMQKAGELQMLINAGRYPVNYEILSNRMVYSEITRTDLMYTEIAILVIVLIALIFISVKYKTAGILSSVAFIGFISIFSLLLRYTNVMISKEGILAIIVIFAINLRLNQIILSKIQKLNNMVNDATKASYKELFLRLIPVVILTIVFCLSGWSNLISFGNVMFWGLILIAIYNVLVTRTLLRVKENN